MIDKKTRLLALIEEDPNNLFLTYALGKAYENEGDDSSAIKIYKKLMDQNPEYVATYYQLANLYLELGKYEEAKAIAQKGILICEKQNERHAKSELENLHMTILIEEEDNLE